MNIYEIIYKKVVLLIIISCYGDQDQISLNITLKYILLKHVRFDLLNDITSLKI